MLMVAICTTYHLAVMWFLRWAWDSSDQTVHHCCLTRDWWVNEAASMYPRLSNVKSDASCYTEQTYRLVHAVPGWQIPNKEHTFLALLFKWNILKICFSTLTYIANSHIIHNASSENTRSLSIELNEKYRFL